MTRQSQIKRLLCGLAGAVMNLFMAPVVQGGPLKLSSHLPAAYYACEGFLVVFLFLWLFDFWRWFAVALWHLGSTRS